MPSQTLNELFFARIARRPSPAAFRVPRAGAYHDVSIEHFARDVERASLGLVARGVRQGDRVAILSENRYEWAVADFAILTAAAITVPIFPTLPSRQIEHVLQDSGARALFVSTEEQLQRIVAMGPLASGLDTLITFDPCSAEDSRRLSVEALFALAPEDDAAGEHRRRAALARSDDVATIIYTSGTTGIPKGVMLTHGNVVANVDSCLQRLDVGPGDVYLSFLPLSHVLERMGGQFTMLRAGASIAYAESPERIARNLMQVRPTITIGVPRFFERSYDRIQQAIRAAPPVKQRLFRWSERTGLEHARATLGGRRPSALLRARRAAAEALVFRNLRAQFGGRIRIFVSGGAPLSREIVEFFFAVGLPVYEGYGLTETAPVLAMNFAGSLRPGTAGKPVPGIEIAIAPDGEILARGPSIMSGYYGDEESTREALRDGWLHTGDLGRFDDDGYLVITDRKKDLLVTAGGKNVAPQPIESLLKASPYVIEAVLFGDRRRFVAALLVPDFALLEEWAASQGIASAGRAALVQDERVRSLYRSEIERVNRDLAPFERIRRFEVLPEELTISGGDLTPTLKVKRAAVAGRFAALVEKLFFEEA